MPYTATAEAALSWGYPPAMARGSNEQTEILSRLSVHALEHASGATLVLWSRDEPWNVSEAAGPIHHYPDEPTDVIYDSIVSVGQLGLSPNLPQILVDLKDRMDEATVLHFCEPTVARDESGDSVPQDVTTELWRHGFTVYRCFRERARYRMRNHEFCWGRARLTPEGAPPRPWAEGSTGSGAAGDV